MKSAKIQNIVNKVLKFIREDIWIFDQKGMTRFRRRLILVSKWLYLTVSGFVNDKCMLRASALTYTTLLSIVPFLAVAFSISKGFGFQNTDYIRNILMKVAGGRAMVVDNIVSYINNTNVGTLGAIGIATLLFSVISLLGNIEKSFNTIWGVKKNRSIGRKFVDYLSVTMVFPLLLIVAISSTATLQSNTIVQKILSVSVFSYLYLVLLKFLPYIMVWMALMFIYIFIPNTKVKVLSGVVGGVVAGTIWQVAQWGYLGFQVGVTKYNAIYGSFAQLPLFLIWLYLSWVIVLLGAEMCFAFQNLKTFQKTGEGIRVSHEVKQKLAVRILMHLAGNFEAGGEPVSGEHIAEKLNVPIKLVTDLLHILEEGKLVIHATRPDGEYYGLMKPAEKMRLIDILGTVDRYREEEIVLPADRESLAVNRSLEVFEAHMMRDKANRSLKELL